MIGKQGKRSEAIEHRAIAISIVLAHCSASDCTYRVRYITPEENSSVDRQVNARLL